MILKLPRPLRKVRYATSLPLARGTCLMRSVSQTRAGKKFGARVCAQSCDGTTGPIDRGDYRPGKRGGVEGRRAAALVNVGPRSCRRACARSSAPAAAGGDGDPCHRAIEGRLTGLYSSTFRPSRHSSYPENCPVLIKRDVAPRRASLSS
jgi:hypothetical protein